VAGSLQDDDAKEAELDKEKDDDDAKSEELDEDEEENDDVAAFKDFVGNKPTSR
jgi:hypothetical protein